MDINMKQVSRNGRDITARKVRNKQLWDFLYTCFLFVCLSYCSRAHKTNNSIKK